MDKKIVGALIPHKKIREKVHMERFNLSTGGMKSQRKTYHFVLIVAKYSYFMNSNIRHFLR